MAYTTIDKSTDYFNAKTYTGNGTSNSSSQSIDMGLQPDLTWIKNRNLTGASNQAHHLFDNVRGGNLRLMTDFNSAESDKSDRFNGITSTGFNLVQDDAGTNRSPETYVAWGWEANGSGSSNTNGSITSTVSANTTSGFSIVSWTGNATDGATVGHGLGGVPEMIIGKDRSDSSSWGIWHKDLTNGGYRLSFDTSSESDDSALFGGSSRTTPTSSVFTLGVGGGLNGTNGNIAYCFRSIKGFSKIGKFTSNGSDDGTFTYCGFKPAWVLMKANVTDGWSNWYLFDNARNPHNLTELALYPNLSKADDEYGGSNYSQIDMLSNGFKMRRDGNWGLGGSGKEIYYMAFAEAPLVASNDVPTTAR